MSKLILALSIVLASSVARAETPDQHAQRVRLEQAEAYQNIHVWKVCHKDSSDYGQWLKCQVRP